jgi:hypothetical protein
LLRAIRVPEPVIAGQSGHNRVSCSIRALDPARHQSTLLEVFPMEFLGKAQKHRYGTFFAYLPELRDQKSKALQKLGVELSPFCYCCTCQQ